MDDAQLAELVIKHDKHIDSVTQSVKQLTDAVSVTNRKLEDVVGVIIQQNLLMEKFTNLEENLKESFSRVHTRTKDIEDLCNGEGCPALKLSKKDVKSLEKRVTRLESIPTWITKTIAVFLILGVLGAVVSFGIG